MDERTPFDRTKAAPRDRVLLVLRSAATVALHKRQPARSDAALSRARRAGAWMCGDDPSALSLAAKWGRRAPPGRE